MTRKIGKKKKSKVQDQGEKNKCADDKNRYRTSLVVQWLRHHTPNAGGPGSFPGQATGSHMLQLKFTGCNERSCMLQWRLKILWAATNPVQANKQINIAKKSPHIILSEELPGNQSKKGYALFNWLFSPGERTEHSCCSGDMSSRSRSSTSLCGLATVTEDTLCVRVLICECMIISHLASLRRIRWVCKHKSALNIVKCHTHGRYYCFCCCCC